MNSETLYFGINRSVADIGLASLYYTHVYSIAKSQIILYIYGQKSPKLVSFSSANSWCLEATQQPSALSIDSQLLSNLLPNVFHWFNLTKRENQR